MPHVTFTRHLLRFFPSLTEGPVPGATIREVIDELEKRHPGFAAYIVDETGRVRRHVNLFVREEPICDRETLSDKVSPDDKVFILQSLSGG
jgi:sulfur-carrier protein